MAKFCGNCGAASADNAAVCGNCGAPFTADNAAAAAPKNDASGANDSKQALIKKIGMIAIPVVAIIVVLAIIFGAIVPNVGYKGTINKFLNAIEDEDVEKYMEYVASYKFDNNNDADDAVEDDLKDWLEELEYEYGENIKFSIKVVDSDKLTEDRLEDIQDAYDDSEDCDDMEITKGYDVLVDLTVKGKDMDRVSEKMNFIVIKEDGKWKIWSGTFVRDYSVGAYDDYDDYDYYDYY